MSSRFVSGAYSYAAAAYADISIQHPETHKITDFFSFYSLPSTVINNPKHSLLEAAYLFYYASDVAFQEGADERGLLKHRLQDLIQDAIVIADQAKFDVFNALTLMDNNAILSDLKVSWLYVAPTSVGGLMDV